MNSEKKQLFIWAFLSLLLITFLFFTDKSKADGSIYVESFDFYTNGNDICTENPSKFFPPVGTYCSEVAVKSELNGKSLRDADGIFPSGFVWNFFTPSSTTTNYYFSQGSIQFDVVFTGEDFNWSMYGSRVASSTIEAFVFPILTNYNDGTNHSLYYNTYTSTTTSQHFLIEYDSNRKYHVKIMWTDDSVFDELKVCVDSICSPILTNGWYLDESDHRVNGVLLSSTFTTSQDSFYIDNLQISNNPDMEAVEQFPALENCTINELCWWSNTMGKLLVPNLQSAKTKLTELNLTMASSTPFGYFYSLKDAFFQLQIDSTSSNYFIEVPIVSETMGVNFQVQILDLNDTDMMNIFDTARPYLVFIIWLLAIAIASQIILTKLW